MFLVVNCLSALNLDLWKSRICIKLLNQQIWDSHIRDCSTDASKKTYNLTPVIFAGTIIQKITEYDWVNPSIVSR